MAANRSIRNFQELRNAAEMTIEASQAILDFLSEQGIGGASRKVRRVNGDAASIAPPANLGKMKAKAKALFASRGSAAREPDGKHVTIKEAAKLLKVSDASVRNWMAAGKLPAPIYEARPSPTKLMPDRKIKTMVLARSAVDKFAEERKTETKRN